MWQAIEEVRRQNDRVWNGWVSATSNSTCTIQGIWGSWASQTYTSNTSTLTSSTIAWNQWIGQNQAGNQLVGAMPRAWGAWVTENDLAAIRARVRAQPVSYDAPHLHPITPQQHAEWLERQRRAKIERFKAALVGDIKELERKKATERAELLLQQHLTEEQRRDRATKGFFLVEAKSGRVYKVEKNGQHGNVKLVDKAGKDLASFCIQPQMSVPDADAHLAQKLLILVDEEQFIRIANISYKADAVARELEPIRRARPAARAA